MDLPLPEPEILVQATLYQRNTIRARVPYGWYACEEPRTPEEIAADCMLLSKASLLGVIHSPANRRRPLDGLGTAQDVVAVAEFLTSNSGRFVTVEFIAVDGGITC